jgi:high-affinity iron transporter
MLGAFLIGLREGLEAALVVGILLAYVRRIGRRDLVRPIAIGVGIAIAISLAVGAILTFGAYGLSFQAQEIIGGSLSLVAVAMVTGMVFWMGASAANMEADLEHEIDARIDRGSGWGFVVLAVVSVGREGLETALFVWSTTRGTGDNAWYTGFGSAVLGIVAAVAIAWLLMRGMLRVDLSKFFLITGVVLVVLAGGVLAYAIGDLQEAAVIAGPYLAAPDGAPAWLAGWYGQEAWAFQLSGSIPPDGLAASLLKGTIGFVPDMSKLSVLAWAIYLAVTMTLFARQYRRNRARRAARTAAKATAPEAA